MLNVWVWGLFLPLIFRGYNPGTESKAPKIYTVEIREMKFVPAEIRVNKGDTIVWVNRDMVAHNVTEEKSKAWASPLLPVGKSWKMVASKNSAYFCSLHPVMKGRIAVQ
ncbi:hypothetical protein AAE02nite_24470 [Adhaeribacter aerolatus]|uniref:Blue (type 1) copper domain-containing protein n=1 Tax=Adhaeribacter aerolatus TaxID=670289 RepID=A0A512AYI9_9BACT|nr:plastocyanin/azurin family copper-binding protein [Adhaeribacter aerolatus]GEO04783.1 hypothetical protein AAE02nite_24470 [Adhaeribacter aerolatus]